MLRRFTWYLIAIPAALVLVTLAVSNSHRVRFVLDPFRPENPALSLDLPFYIFMFAALIVGVVLGGIATWMAQAHWRRLARRRGADAVRWQAEAERLVRERDRQVTATRQLVAADR